jgi:Fungal rhodopsin domain
VQVIAPAVFNVAADIILFIYPFPIIFMANIPQSLRYSLLFVFALCGVVTASAIIRVAIMCTENFLQAHNIYASAPGRVI